MTQKTTEGREEGLVQAGIPPPSPSPRHNGQDLFQGVCGMDGIPEGGKEREGKAGLLFGVDSHRGPTVLLEGSTVCQVGGHAIGLWDCYSKTSK